MFYMMPSTRYTIGINYTTSILLSTKLHANTYTIRSLETFDRISLSIKRKNDFENKTDNVKADIWKNKITPRKTTQTSNTYPTFHLLLSHEKKELSIVRPNDSIKEQNSERYKNVKISSWA